MGSFFLIKMKQGGDAMELSVPLIDKTNTFIGIIIAILTYAFGDHWNLFAGFLLLNIGDYITRWIAARITGTECSQKGWIGILKKIGYWIMIAVAFGMSAIFIEIGVAIGYDLGVTTLLGWFVLATLIVNEIRSILENLVDAGCPVPNFMIKGLNVVNKAIDGIIEIHDIDNEDYDVNFSKSLKDLDGQKRVTFEIDQKKRE